MEKFNLPAGSYYIGDPCYVIRDKDWEKVCDVLSNTSGVLNVLSLPFFMAGTAYGDGTYQDNDQNEYPVDSGTLGAVPVELIDIVDPDATIKKFPNGLFIQYENGIFQFGDIYIDTKGE